MLFGSIVLLIDFITGILSGCSSRRYSFLWSPTPCSPVIVPFNSNAFLINKPLNSLAISKNGRIATGGDSEILYRSKSVFDSNITPQNIVYDQMKFNSSMIPPTFGPIESISRITLSTLDIKPFNLLTSNESGSLTICSY